jgi:hypothetical protein
MSAYARLQAAEFEQAAQAGYAAVKHQRFAGTGYFDTVTEIITAGNSSTVALRGSTEQDQFESLAGPSLRFAQDRCSSMGLCPVPAQAGGLRYRGARQEPYATE